MTDNNIILPRTETEIVLYEIWRNVWNVKTWSVTDHFMTLGGDSFAAVILLFELEEKYEIIDWEVEDIYDTPTIEKLA